MAGRLNEKSSLGFYGKKRPYGSKPGTSTPICTNNTSVPRSRSTNTSTNNARVSRLKSTNNTSSKSNSTSANDISVSRSKSNDIRSRSKSTSASDISVPRSTSTNNISVSTRTPTPINKIRSEPNSTASNTNISNQKGSSKFSTPSSCLSSKSATVSGLFPKQSVKVNVGKRKSNSTTPSSSLRYEGLSSVRKNIYKKQCLVAQADQDLKDPVNSSMESGDSDNALTSYDCRLDQNPCGLNQNSSGLDQNSSGLDQNSSGLDQNSSGLDQSSSGLDQNSSALNQDSSGLDQNPCGLDQNSSGLNDQNSSGLDRNPFGLDQNFSGLNDQNPSGLDQNSSGLDYGLDQNSIGLEDSPIPSEMSLSDHTSHDPKNGSEDILLEILKEVKSSNQMLQQKVLDLEKKYHSLHQSQILKVKKEKRVKPSREVRDTVRKVYKALHESDENFGWSTDEFFSSATNQDTMRKLVADAKAHLPDTTAATIQAAARTYFTSIAGIQRLKNSDKYASKCILQRRRNRLTRKLDSRRAMLLKTSSIPEDQKKKWAECLIPELMSSEESEEDGSFSVRPLPWRSEKATHFLKSLDNKIEKKKTKKSQIMTLKRSTGISSDRHVPTTDSVPAWTIKP